jgi:hypothetical protein
VVHPALAVPDPIVREAWSRGVNAPQSSAAGRVFDAMAAIVLGVAETSFEGQAPMWLEARASAAGEFPTLPIVGDADGLPRIDWSPLLEWCGDDGRSVEARASAAHLALADAICRVAEDERARSGAAWFSRPAAGADPVQRRRPRLRPGRRIPGAPGRRRRASIDDGPGPDGYTPRMLWCERPFLNVLRREIRELSPVHTISIETNPNHLEPDVLCRYRDAGVTRCSVGVQSFDDGLLAGMDRLEKCGSGAGIRAGLVAARGIFPTLNVDMIFNLPGQTLAMLGHDIDTLLELDVDQISFYPLMTAATARNKMQKTMGVGDESLRHVMYERVLDRLLPGHRAASAAVHSATWAERCTRRRFRSTITAGGSRAGRAASRSGARSGSRSGCATTTWCGCLAAL